MASERPEPEVRGGRAQHWAPRYEGEGPAAGRSRGLLRVWVLLGRTAWAGTRPAPKALQLNLVPAVRNFLWELEKKLVNLFCLPKFRTRRRL